MQKFKQIFIKIIQFTGIKTLNVISDMLDRGHEFNYGKSINFVHYDFNSFSMGEREHNIKANLIKQNRWDQWYA